MQSEKSSSKKTFLIIIVLLIVGAGVYFYFQGNPTDSSSSLTQPGSPESADASAVGIRVLSLLNQINSLKIDTSIFNSLVYRSLVDYSITIPEQNVGRANPFVPVSGQ